MNDEQKAIAKLNEKADDALSGTERALTREQRLSKAHNHALGIVKDAHIEEFNAAKVAEAKRLGVTWEPKLTKEQQARKELDALLAENPFLEAEIIKRVHEEMRSAAAPAEHEDTGGQKQPEVNAADESVPARAIVLGYVRQGRMTGDGEHFAYPAGGGTERTSEFKLVADDTPLGRAEGDEFWQTGQA